MTKQYLTLLDHVLSHGNKKEDRTGTGVLSVFGYQDKYDLSKGFPLLTTKKLHVKSIVHELLWMLSGSTNVRYLQENGVKIWNEWADEQGELGPVYGKQLRRWAAPDGTEVDQIANLIHGIKTHPTSRRHILNMWNVGELGDMKLPPCHAFSQFYVHDGKLSCQLYQRSGDVFLGVPFNIASYSLLTHMIAQVCGLKVGEFVHSFGDVHLYLNHVEQAKEQLKRTPGKMPTLSLDAEITDISGYNYNNITFINYKPQPHIKGKVSI